jgi:hypothetical protein
MTDSSWNAPSPDDELPEAGERIVVRTPDQREFRGEYIALRDGRVVVRLDTGWVTTYPRRMVFRDRPRRGGAS